MKDIGPKKADASREADRQKLRETINQLQPFQGKPRTFGQLRQHYIENELRIEPVRKHASKVIDRTLTANGGRRRSTLGSVMRKTDRRSPRLRKYSVTDARGAIMSDVIVWIAI